MFKINEKYGRNRNTTTRLRRRTRAIAALATAAMLVAAVYLLPRGREVEREETTPPAEENAAETRERAEAEVIRIVSAEMPAEEPEKPEEDEHVREDIPLDAEIQRLLYKACAETGISHDLALAVVWQETDFRNVLGDDGESAGYMQVQERWHKERMARLGVSDLKDPYSNFLVGCDYLSELLAKGKGVEWALMAYNGGPSYANKMTEAGKVSGYAASVIRHMEEL